MSKPDRVTRETWRLLKFLGASRVRKFTSMQLVIALTTLIITSPWLADGSMEILESSLVSITLITALAAIGAQRRVFITSIALITTPLVARWFMHLSDDRLLREIYLVSSLVFMLYVTLQMLRYVVRATVVDTNVLFTSMAVYLLCAFVWSIAYELVAVADPNAYAILGRSGSDAQLNSFTALYLSVVTLTTVGYGDIVPVSNVARVLAMLQAITGVLFLAVLIARLVSQHASVIRAPDSKE